MKKILLTLAVVMASAATYAQQAAGTFSLQPKAGINIANMTNFDNTKARVDFVGGVEGEYQVTDIFSLSAGVLYSRQGVKEKDVTVAGLTVKGDSWSPSYINIPILANVYVVKGLAVKAGIQPGFVVGKDNMDGMKTFDFTIPVGLSYEFSQLPFVIDARYNWGLTKVLDTTGDTPKNSVFQITLGYKFAL